MFKLESYIAPILLSYVDKYIKNFKLEDSQVSLWGGDASFQNLDLRLEVLEEELQLPFHFVSGHIRELLIHVPWTKLTSEPITITINTIECILKLKTSESNSSPSSLTKKREKRKKIAGQRLEIDVPPNYVQLLINKIVSNIRIYCNNVILKYVEEDIVLSMNVKLLKFESANERWETAYTDLSSTQINLRKLIGINDLTICLDKRNAAGKIDFYQEPMLYRCSLTMHLLRYYSMNDNKNLITRLDVYCNNMEFSMTKQQVPMVLRLLKLLYALQQKQLKSDINNHANNSNLSNDDKEIDEQTWAGWAWSYVAAVLPGENGNEFDESFGQANYTLQLGFYIDNASLTFKVSESNSDRAGGYYTQKKIRYWPLLTLQIQGLYSETISHGIKWLNSTFGVSQLLLIPAGFCSCSHIEVLDYSTAVPYLKIGTLSSNHKTDSLFDVEAIENKGQSRNYNTNWDYHMNINSESVLLERTPAFVSDYVYCMEIPDDMSSEVLSELGSDFEFSDLSEKSSLRICIGPLKLRLCSGLFHRIDSLLVAASAYDYAPYYVPKPDALLNELLPPSAEDFDSLNKFIPYRTIQINFFAPVIELQLMDHQYFKAEPGKLFRKHKKISNQLPQINDLPKIIFECQLIDLSFFNPMYINRLVHTTCQLPDLPKQLFDACYSKQNLKFFGLSSSLIINSNIHTTIIVPFNLSYESKSILKPQYWIKSNIPHKEILFESENVTINGTKAKILIIYHIINKMLNVYNSEEFGNSLNDTSLLSDASSKDNGMPYLEICLENLRFRQVTTNSTVSIDIQLGSIKAFIFESIDLIKNKDNNYDIEQVLFLSGPEPTNKQNNQENIKEELINDDITLFTATIQYPLNPELQSHPPIIIFNLQEMKISVDPLLIKWLLYFPRIINHSETHMYTKTKSLSDTSGSILETPRRSSAQIESVHSSSDKDLLQLPSKPVKVPKEDEIDLQEKICNFLKNWAEVWKGMLLCGDISQFTIFFPMVSLSAIGAQGIEETIQHSINSKTPADILVIILPSANLRSFQKQNLIKYLTNLPVKLPDYLWTAEKSTFPWTLSLTDLTCFTIQNSIKEILLKPITISATIALSTKNKNEIEMETTNIINDNNKLLKYLGICIHIDMTPLIITISQIQVYLFSNIINGLIEVITNLLPINNNKSKNLPNKTTEQIILPTIIKEDLSPTVSPTVLQQQDSTTLDSLSENLLLTKTDNDDDDNDLKLTVWIQWTITKFTIELLTKQQKLVVDIEDIVSSLDFQLIYLKLKSKIGSITSQHYKLSNDDNKWELGEFSGIVMRLRDDVLIEERLLEDNSLISITITRASCQHTHTLWGAAAVQQQKKKSIKKDKKIHQQNNEISNRYITEIVINVQPIDFVLSMNTLKDFYLILKPLLLTKTTANENKQTETTNNNNLLNILNNQTLPLAYLDCRDIRLIIPSIELYENNNDLINNNQDVFIFQINKISLNPSAINPICRTPIRSDIYLQAAQARILNIPGSEIEDRQYQLDVIGISINTTKWSDLNTILNNSVILRGMSENPAVEWNNLEQGQLSINPILNLTPITDKFDISIIVAPAMIYNTDMIICGNSMEINCISDINLNLSLGQLKLISTLLIEFKKFFEFSSTTEFINQTNKYSYNKFSYYNTTKCDNFIKLSPTVNDENNEFVEFNELYKDSGIDTSEIRSVFSTKNSKILLGNNNLKTITPIINQTTNIIPIDILFTAGKINFSLYELNEINTIQQKQQQSKLIRNKSSLLKLIDCDQETGYEASEEDSVDNERYCFNNLKKKLPLLFISLSQPNLYLSKQYLIERIQASCFDISIKLNTNSIKTVHIPIETDFLINLLETRSGKPNQSTGILPAFFTLKYVKNFGENANLDIEISKPTKINFSLNKLLNLILIKNKLIENCIILLLRNDNKETIIKDEPSNNSDCSSSYQLIKEKFYGINKINLKFDQIIFIMKSTDESLEMNLSINKIKNQLTLINRPEKLCNLTTFDSITLSVITQNDNLRKLILNPWTITMDLCLFWESWQNTNCKPQIRLTFESDCLIINLIPKQIKNISVIINEVIEFLSTIQLGNDQQLNEFDDNENNKEQYYKDDLRAGAFQFVDSNTNNINEFPLPYQVMFWNKDFSAMVWRYPQPRALMKVRVFPVPYKLISIDTTNNDLQVLCELQYWSDCHNCYLPYTQFYLSENEVCHLNLPKGDPKQPVASIWRVLLTTINNNNNNLLQISISPRALAACMRIDSYFNQNLIPNLMIAFYLSKITLNFFTLFDKSSTDYNLPDCLKCYSPDFMLPELQCFLTLTLENLQLFLTSWNLSVLNFDINFAIQCTVLDYLFLIEQNLIETFSTKIELSISKKLHCNFISKPIQIKFGPSIAHTLAVSGQLWSQSFQQNLIKDFIILTRYIICNNTSVNLRFGQINTDENILLPSKYFHMYSWRTQKSKPLIKLALEENGWLWSKPFKIDDVGIHVIHLNNENNLTIIVKIVEISATQKQVIISGQLIISNMLLEHFEFKLIEDVKNNKENEFRKSPIHILAGKTITSSMFINCKKKYFLRLRFFGLESAWTGDIPLQEHTKGTKPWLVKVPLQDKGQFLSIWCRIVIQDFHNKGQKILAMLWPLFMVKSSLPFSSNVHIETAILNVRLDATINGKGELQQLYCPGTIDHSHQLIFDDGITTSSPYIPLSYGLVDQQKFFKKNPKEDIDEILNVLMDFDKTKWPYFGDDLDNIEWSVEDQPLTTVQVRYQNVCNYSSALLLELLPWCLMVNTLGCPISLAVNGIELCRLNQHCIIAPPKLDENFHLGVNTGMKWNFSNPLQLAKSDWSQTFYMPRITGTIPLDGNIKINVKCDLHICMISITSSLINEIRLLKISSTHVFSNLMSTQIQVVCFAVPDIDHLFDLPKNFEEFSFTVAPRLDKSSSGISLIQWYSIDVNSDLNTDYALYMSFATKSELGWSCPVRVDKIFTRKNIVVVTNKSSIPMSLTCQEYKGQIYLSLHHDTRPQILIDNQSDIILFCAQSLSDFGNKIADECQHFKWYNKLDIGKCIYYTMPIFSEKFPELPQKNFTENIVFSCQPEDDTQDFQWSIPISIVTDTEYFVHIPYYGDIKLIIKNTAFTTLLVIHSVSYVQISARDIRVRLSMHEMKMINSQQQAYLQQQQQKLIETNSNISKSCDTTILGENSNNDLTQSSEYEIELSSSSLNSIESNTTIIDKKRSDLDVVDITTNSPINKSILIPTIPLNNTKSIEIFIVIKLFSITFISDYDNLNLNECCEIANFTCDNIGLILNQEECLNVNLTISGIQFDNQLYTRESYDFPVVLIGQDIKNDEEKLNTLNIPIIDLLKIIQENALIIFEMNLETWYDTNQNKSITGLKDVKLIFNPLNCFIEDIYITRLNNYLKVLIPTNLILWPKTKKLINFNLNSVSVLIPDIILWQSKLLAKSLTIKNITVEPLSLLLSVHCSVKLYIALDQSSLVFGRFERKRLFTTPDRLGHALTMHYISGALFGAGWVVSSLELLGSPGGLARAMRIGLRDFISLPYRGLVQGPWAFLTGVTHGSASLMKHMTAGTVQSVTKLASSVARNLDRLTLDEEHLKRTEEQRRQKPQGLTQGFIQGLTGLGISLLGAVGGIAHHPLQSVMSDQASPISLARGVGLGLVGVFTKPLSGAAELVALTGQGLLQGAGWNPLPTPRTNPESINIKSSTNSILKYNWKLLYTVSRMDLLFVIEATSITNSTKYEAIALILTIDALIIIDLSKDCSQRIISLNELQIIDNDNDPTLLSFKLISPTTSNINTTTVAEITTVVEDDLRIEMDPACRARVADYVRNTVGLLQLPTGNDNSTTTSHSEISISPLNSPNQLSNDDNNEEMAVLTYYVNPQFRNYFVSLLNLAKQQKCNNNFPVLL